MKGRADQLQRTTISSSNKALEIFEEMKIKTQEAIEKSKAVDQINNLTENIKQISSKTNLLALNANIEAARAGEAGKGFAVVATEIGNLSNQTYATVDGITEMVTEVNSAVNSMTDCMTTIMDFLENTVVLDYNSFREIGKEYQADANTFADAMGRIYSEITKLDDENYILLGVAKLDDINEALHINLESEDYDSIGGYIIEQLDCLPKEGQSVTLESGIRLVVDRLDKNRIELVHIWLPEKKTETEEQP